MMRHRAGDFLWFVFGPSLLGLLLAVAAMTFFMGCCATAKAQTSQGANP